MTEAEETLRYIIDTLRINYALKNPDRDKRTREDAVIKRMGKGWCRTNLHYFKRIVEYDIIHENAFKFSLAILTGESTIGEVLKLVESEGNYTDLDELESHLYITALCNVKRKLALDNLRKIGRGDDYHKRMRSLTSDINKKYLSGTKSPYGYMPVKLWRGRTDIIIEVEKRLHKEFNHLRVDGEFFEMDQEFFEKIEDIIDEYDLTEIETNDIVIDYDSIKKEYTMEELMDLVKEEIDFKDLN
jgi:hypothetical protein